MDFDGFPVAALDFYDDLEVDNSKTFWEAHRHVYEQSVKAPMVALCASLEQEFGTAKVFRPYRDVRFRKDKTPYKTHQGAFVALGPRRGWYVELSPRGVRVGGGFYAATPAELAAVRAAIDDDRSGASLRRIVTKLEKAGYTIGGDTLRTAPRGYDQDHPRIALLRHKTLSASRSYGFEPVIHTPAVRTLVREDWLALRPLVRWVDTAMSEAEEPTV